MADGAVTADRRARVLDDGIDIAQAHGDERSIHWPQGGPTRAWDGLPRGLVVLWKSTRRGRTGQVLDCPLSDEDVGALDTTGPTDRARERKWC